MVEDGSPDRGAPEVQDDGGIPVSTMVESIVGCKWSVRLLQLLTDGPSRPSAMLRACPGLSAKVMNERMRKMGRFGIVARSVLGEKPPLEVDYALTALGRRFIGILDEVRRLQEAVDNGMMSKGAEIHQAAERRPDRSPTAGGRSVADSRRKGRRQPRRPAD